MTRLASLGLFARVKWSQVTKFTVYWVDVFWHTLSPVPEVSAGCQRSATVFWQFRWFFCSKHLCHLVQKGIHGDPSISPPWLSLANKEEKMIVCRSHGTPQINSPSPRCLLFQWTLILIQHLSVATYESWQISPLKLPYVPTKWACKHASKFHVLRITYPLGIFNITNYTCMYSKLFFSIGDCTMFRGKL